MVFTPCGCEVSLHGPSLADRCYGGTFVLFMSILEQILRTQCDVEDPCNHFSSVESPSDTYDFIVIGGGSAGSVVASRLSEVKEWSVLLVEAGVNEPTGCQVPSLYPALIGSDIDWKYKTEPEEQACLNQKERRCSWPRGKVIGGTSVINGMMYMRGGKKDFETWEKLGNKEWSYEDVLPYYMKSENNLQIDKVDKGYHSVGGHLPVGQFNYHPPLAEDILKAAEELGYRVGDLNGEKHSGFAIAQMTSFEGKRYSSARAFLRPAKHRPNLHVVLNTTVAKVLVDKNTKTVLGVELVKANGEKLKINSKKEVIVSGGAVNSPQILLLSGIGPEEDLKQVGVPVVHNLPGVGKNLHNHVAYKVNFFIDEKNTNDMNWKTVMEYITKREGLLSGTGLGQLTGLVSSKFVNPEDDHPDIQFFFDGYKAKCSKTGNVDEVEEGKNGKAFPKKTITFSAVAIQPKSTGYLKLKDSSHLSPPLIYARYLTERRDVETLIEGIKITLKLSKTKALEKYKFELDAKPEKNCENKTFGSDEYWECAVRQGTFHENHQSGSCKMGPAEDKSAVVDNRLRVHGIKGVRVMDTSIMPRVVTGNTNAPAMMIGERGSDFIKEDWGVVKKGASGATVSS